MEVPPMTSTEGTNMSCTSQPTTITTPAPFDTSSRLMDLSKPSSAIITSVETVVKTKPLVAEPTVATALIKPLVAYTTNDDDEDEMTVDQPELLVSAKEETKMPTPLPAKVEAVAIVTPPVVIPKNIAENDLPPLHVEEADELITPLKAKVALVQEAATVAPIAHDLSVPLPPPASVSIAENKLQVPPPAPPIPLEQKKVKQEKIDQQESIPANKNVVPPVVLSLSTPRSRSSSHSSKSSKRGTSPAAAPSPTPKPRQKIKRPNNLSKDVAQIFDGVNDFYCWICHKDGQVLCCECCPRVFHTKCLNMKKAPEGDWFCNVCEQIEKAGCEETRSKAMSSLSTSEFSEHLKFALKRLEISGSEPFREPVDTKVFKDYLEYVFNPMDLKTLEKKRKANEYGSTEAFLADVQWILHNCIIYNGPNNKLTAIARQIVKTAEFEMTEIEVCPECYLNAGRNRPNWFCEPCKTPHIMIWAKLQGFPHWPAKALRIDRGSVDARFFGQHDRAWIPQANCYLYSKELPFPVKNKKKAGAKGGLDNAIAEAQLYIDNVKKASGKFEYAKLRTPLSYLHISRNSAGLSYTGADCSGQGSTQEDSDNEWREGGNDDPKSLANQIKNFTQPGANFSAILPPKKKSAKVVTTSGVHPRKTKHQPMLGQTIRSCANSIETSMDHGLLDDMCGDDDDSESSDGSSLDSKPDSKEKNGAGGNVAKKAVVESGSDSELTIDAPQEEDQNQQDKSSKAHINLSKYSTGMKRKKAAVEAAAAAGGKKVEGGGLKRKHVSSNADDNVNGAKIRRSENAAAPALSSTTPKTTLEKSFLKKKQQQQTPESSKKTTAERSSKLNKTSSQNTAVAGGGVKKRGMATPDKLNLKNTAKALSQKMSGSGGKKNDKFTGKDLVSSKDGGIMSRKLNSFTIPKHNKSNNDDGASKNSEVSPSSSRNNHSDSNNTSSSKFALVQKYSDRASLMFRQFFAEMYDESCKSASGENSRSNQKLRSKCEELEQQNKQLKDKITKMIWEHSQEITEKERVSDLRAAEMKHAFDMEKKHQLDDVRRRMEQEKKKAVEETKKKQWCNNCGKEAVLYCCWNTSYCDYPCQEMHWITHMSSCAQHQENQQQQQQQTTVVEQQQQPEKPQQQEVEEEKPQVDSDDEAMVIAEDVAPPPPPKPATEPAVVAPPTASEMSKHTLKARVLSDLPLTTTPPTLPTPKSPPLTDVERPHEGVPYHQHDPSAPKHQVPEEVTGPDFSFGKDAPPTSS